MTTVNGYDVLMVTDPAALALPAVVSGTVTYRDGEPTGALPGELVRAGPRAATEAA